MTLGAALAAGILGAGGPFVLARLPEPAEPADDKARYKDLAATPFLGVWLGLAAAIAAAVLATFVEPEALLPAWVVLSGVGVWLAFIDWRTKLLPTRIVIPLNAVLLVLVVTAAALEGDWSILVRALSCAVAVFLVFYLSNLVYPQGLGYGDVRLSFGLGLALGAIGVWAAFLGPWLGFTLGAICSIALARLKIVDARDFAMGPYLIVGAALAACWSPAIF